jgi:hypothetical protein
MGYWATSPEGESFAEGINPDGTKMLWGDTPADMIDDGQEKLIKRLTEEMGCKPAVEEVEAVKFADPPPPEIADAIAEASRYFHEDVERDPTPEEILAGLRFSAAELALEKPHAQ